MSLLIKLFIHQNTLIKVTRRTHPGFSGLWIWWQCPSFLSASSCLCSTPALLFFHPSSLLSLAHQCSINLSTLLCGPVHVWMCLLTAQAGLLCCGRVVQLYLSPEELPPAFQGLTLAVHKGKGATFQAWVLFFPLSITEEVCPDLFASQLLCRSPGGQAVHFPQWVTAFVFANQFCWMKCHVNIFPAPC